MNQRPPIESIHGYIAQLHQAEPITAQQLETIKQSLAQHPEAWEDYFFLKPDAETLIPDDLLLLYYETLYRQTPAAQPGTFKLLGLKLNFFWRRWGRQSWNHLWDGIPVPIQGLVAVGLVAIVSLQLFRSPADTQRIKGNSSFTPAIPHHLSLYVKKNNGHWQTKPSGPHKITAPLAFKIDTHSPGRLVLALFHHPTQAIEVFFSPPAQTIFHPTTPNQLLSTPQGIVAYRFEPQHVGRVSICSFLFTQHLDRSQTLATIKTWQHQQRLFSQSGVPTNCQQVEITP